MKWVAIKKAGAKGTMKFKVACYERCMCIMKAAAVGQDATPELKITYYGKVLAKSHTWPESPGEADELSDVCEPTLPSVGATDKATAKLFTSTVFSWIANLMKGGENGKDEVLQHASLASCKLELPEDAEIGDECAKVHTEGMSALAALQAVGNDGITDKTDIEALESIKDLDAEGHRTDGVITPMQLLGAAMLEDTWWKGRLKVVIRCSDLLMAEAPKIKARCKEIRQMGSELGEEKAKQLIAIAEEIKYWDATFNEYDAAGELKATLISAAESNVKSLLDMENGKYCLEMKMEARAVYINVFQRLYGVLKDIGQAFDTKIHNTTARLKDAVRNVDTNIQNNMLIEASDSWTEDDEEATLKLKDALGRTAKKTLPADCTEALSKLWNRIFKDICSAEASRFLVDKSDRNFTVLSLLAAQVPDGDREKSEQLSSWVHAAWRVCGLVQATKEMKEAAEAPENDISVEATDKCCRELLKGVQRLECQHAAASKLALAKTNEAFDKITNLVDNAGIMVNSIASNVRSKMVIEMESKQKELSTKISTCKEKSTFEANAEKASDLAEIKSLFEQGYDTIDTAEWLAACVEIEDQIKELRSKVLEYNLFTGDEPPEQEAQKFVTAVRAASCEHSMLAACCNKAIAKDKTAIRKKMREVQANLKSSEIKPQDLKFECVGNAYSAGLKMQAL